MLSECQPQIIPLQLAVSSTTVSHEPTFSFVFSLTSCAAYPPFACGAWPAVLFLKSAWLSVPVVMASSRTAMVAIGAELEGVARRWARKKSNVINRITPAIEMTATVLRKEVGGKWPCGGGWWVVDRMDGSSDRQKCSSLRSPFPTN